MSQHQHSIPDLWRLKEDAERLYKSFLCRLMMHDMQERIVTACRVIRRHAAKAPETRDALFTFGHEIDALFELQNYRGVLRQLRLRERMLFGSRLDLLRLPPSSGQMIEFQYAPVHYFLGNFSVGCILLEAALRPWFAVEKPDSLYIITRVCDGRNRSAGRHNVTLAQFYKRLNKKLSEWADWEPFVKGFDPRVFRLAGMSRLDLLNDCDKLPEFYRRLSDIAKQKGTSLGSGKSTLLDSPAKIRQQKDQMQSHKDFLKRTEPQRTPTDIKLKGLFPEMRVLLK